VIQILCKCKEDDHVSIFKILLFGLLVVVISILFRILTGLIISPTGNETPLAAFIGPVRHYLFRVVHK
jgi:hypothetical protein